MVLSQMEHPILMDSTKHRCPKTAGVVMAKRELEFLGEAVGGHAVKIGS